MNGHVVHISEGISVMTGERNCFRMTRDVRDGPNEQGK